MMVKKLLIFPYGGNAQEALLATLAINKLQQEWEVLGFIDDNPSLKGKKCCGVEVIGDRTLLGEISDAYVLAVPGSPQNHTKRCQTIDNLEIPMVRFAQIIHPASSIAPDAHIGYNTLIASHIAIGCGVTIGNHCFMLANTVVGHDTTIGDHCCIGANVTLSGYVQVGNLCYIGSGTSVKEKITIAEKSLIGIGSNVISDVTGGIFAGNPAKLIRDIPNLLVETAENQRTQRDTES